MARTALAWIWVLAGKTPFARRVMMDLGRVRSSMVVVAAAASLSRESFLSCEASWASGAEAEADVDGGGGGCVGAVGAETADGGAEGGDGMGRSSFGAKRAVETSLLRWSDFRGGMMMWW